MANPQPIGDYDITLRVDRKLTEAWSKAKTFQLYYKGKKFFARPQKFPSDARLVSERKDHVHSIILKFEQERAKRQKKRVLKKESKS